MTRIIETAHASSAGPFDAVHLNVRDGDELRGESSMRWAGGDPDRGRDGDRTMRSSVERALAQDPDNPSCSPMGGGRVRVGQDDRELVAAVARRDVAFPQG